MADITPPLSSIQCGIIRIMNAWLPPNIDLVQATDSLNGKWSWSFGMTNYYSAPVTNAGITVNTSLNPSYFPNVPSFPFTVNAASLAFGESLTIIKEFYNTNYPITFTPGFTATRTVTPLNLPAGGGTQTVAVKVKLTDRDCLATHLKIDFNLWSRVEKVFILQAKGIRRGDGEGQVQRDGVRFFLW